MMGAGGREDEAKNDETNKLTIVILIPREQGYEREGCVARRKF